MDGTVAELFGGQCYCLPFRAAAFHELAVIVKLNAEEQILVRIEIEIFPAVKLDVDVLGFVGKNENGLMALAKDPLPHGQSFDVPDCDPAFETR